MADMTPSDNGTQQGHELPTSLGEAVQAVRTAPEDPIAWERLEDEASTAQMPDEVAQLYLEVLAGQLSVDVANDLGQRATNFLEEWYGEDSDFLNKVLRRLVELDPQCDWAFQRLTVAHTMAGRWEQLLSLYDEVIKLTAEITRRLSLLDEAVNVAKDFAQAPERAIDYLQQLLELRPQDQQLVSSLERLFERQQRWQDLIGLWDTRLPSLDAQEQPGQRLRIARGALDRLDDADIALEQVKAYLVIPGIDEGEALELLEQVVASESASNEARLGAGEVLKERYQASERRDDVVRVLVLTLGLVPAEGRAPFHRELGQRLMALDRHSEAMPHYASLLQLEPTAVDALQQLRELAGRTGDHQAFVEALQAAADRCEVTDGRVALRLEAAETQRTVLGDAEGATALYRSVLGEEDAANAACLKAGRQLNKLLEAADRQEERLDVLERLAKDEPEPGERRRVLGQAARLADELSHTDRALDLWKLRVEDNAHDVEALGEIITILKRESRWEPLIESLLLRADAPVSRRQSREDQVAVARLRAEELDDVEGAISTWLKVRESFGEDDETIAALGELFAKAEKWQDYATLLDGAAARESDHVGEILTRLGEVCRDELATPDRAVQFYDRALRIEPSREQALAGLAKMLEGDESHRSQVAEILARAYEITERWKEVLELLEHRLEARTGHPEKARFLREMAATQETKVDDAEGALSSYCRALVFAPKDVAVEDDIKRLGEVTQAWSVVAQAFNDSAGACFDSDRRQHLLLQAAGIAEESLGDFEAALEAYGTVHGEAPSQGEAALATIRTAGRLNQWERVAEAFMTHTVATGELNRSLFDTIEEAVSVVDGWDEFMPLVEDLWKDQVDQVSVSLGRDMDIILARVHEQHREDAAATEAALRRLTGRRGADEETLQWLAKLQRPTPNRELYDTLVQLADFTIENQNLDPIHEAAKLAVEQLDDLELKQESLSRLYRESSRLWRIGQEATGDGSADGLCRWALDQLVQLHLDGDHFEKAVSLLAEGAQLPVEPAAAREMRRRAAAVAASSLGDSKRAMMIYRGILAGEPEDVETILDAAEVCRGAQLDHELLALLNQELALSQDSERRLALRLEAAAVIGRVEAEGGRLGVLKANLAELPGHPDTITSLVEAMESATKFGELADLLSEQGSLLEDRDAHEPAAQLWDKVAHLAEERLDDKTRALMAYKRVQTLINSVDALDALARLETERGEHAKAARWFDRRLQQTSGAEERIPIFTALSQAHLAAGQEDQGIAALQSALDEAPQLLDLREQLAQLYRDRKEWELLAQVLTDAAPHLEDVDTLRSYAREAAELFSRQGSPDRAITVLEKANNLAPDDRNIRRMLAEGLVAAERLEEGRTILEKLIDDFGRRRNPERAGVHYLLALALKAEGNLEGALEQLDLASKMDVRNTRIAAMLGRLAREAGQLDRAERTYRGLLMVVRRQPSEDEMALGAAEVLYELSRLAKERGSEDQAQELLQSATQTAAQSAVEARRFRRAMEERAEAELLLQVLEMRAETAAPGAELAEALAEVGDALAGQPDRGKDAFDARLRALNEAPDAWQVHDVTRRQAQELEQAQRYADTLRGLVDRFRRDDEAELACRLLLKLGQTLEEDLQNFDEAAEALGRVESLGYFVIEARTALARVAGSRGDRAEEIRLLKELVHDEALKVGDRMNVRYRLAELQLQSADTTADGLAVLEEALDGDSDYERAAAILREATTQQPEDTARLVLYGKVTRAAGDEELFLDYLEKRIASADATLQDVREASELLEKRQADSARIQELLHRAVELAETSDGGLGQALWAPLGIARHLESKGELEQAATWLSQAAEATADSAEQTSLWCKAAQLAAQGGDHGKALSVYEQLMAGGPVVERQVWEPALASARALKDEARMASLEERLLTLLDDEADRNVVLVQYAQLLMDLEGREALAAKLLHRVLDTEPSHDQATVLISELYERIGYDEELTDMLRQKFDAAVDSQDLEPIRDLALRLGELLARIQADQAKEVYRHALQWHPEDRQLGQSLLALLGPDDDPQERVELMERPLATEEGEAAAVLALKLADEWATLFDDGAVDRVLRQGYQACPEHDELRQRLENWFSERGEWENLAELKVAEAKRIADGANTVALLRSAATIYRDTLNNPYAAVNCLAEARGYAPGDLELLRELVVQRTGVSDYQTAVEEVTESLSCCDDSSSERVDMLILRANLYGQMNEDDNAVADLEEAYHRGGVSLASQLQTGLQQQRTNAAVSGNLDAERRATLRLVEVLLEAKEAYQAREVLDQWLDRSPDDREALYQLLALDEAEGQWHAVAHTCGKLVGLETGETQVQMVLKLTNAWEQVDDIVGAREPLEQVMAAQPDALQVRDRLWGLYEKIGAKRELAALLYNDGMANTNETTKLEQLRKAGNLFLELGPEGVELAMAPLEEAARLQPDDHDTAIMLVDCYTGTNRFAEAGQLLESAIAAKGGRRSPQLAELQHRMARLAGVAQDKPLQLQWLNVAFDSDRRNGFVVAELAELAMELGDYDLALSALRVVTVSKVDGPLSRAQAFLMQARIAHIRGEARRAMMWAHRACDEDPELQDAADFLKEIGG
jgi:lipopolysaccharide biosynthesis regulator YciM